MYIEITRKSIAFGFGAIPSINDSGEVLLMLDTTSKVLFLGSRELFLEKHSKGTNLPFAMYPGAWEGTVSFDWGRFSFHYNLIGDARLPRELA